MQSKQDGATLTEKLIAETGRKRLDGAENGTKAGEQEPDMGQGTCRTAPDGLSLCDFTVASRTLRQCRCSSTISHPALSCDKGDFRIMSMTTKARHRL